MAELPLTNSDERIIIDDTLAADLSRFRWNLDRDGYARRSVRDGAKVRTIRIHRFIVGLSWEDEGLDVDHINFNRLDNRRENLRPLPVSKNRGRHYHAQLALFGGNDNADPESGKAYIPDRELCPVP